MITTFAIRSATVAKLTALACGAWFASGGAQAIEVLDAPRGSFACYTSSTRASDVRPAGDSVVYIATDGGLLRMNRDGTNRSLLTRADGLPSHSINEIAAGADGTLWLATAQGIARLSGADIDVFTTRDGLNDNRVYCVEVTGDGAVYAGTHRGLNVLRGARFTPHDDTHEFARRPVFDLHTAQDGTLWVAKETSLSHYLGKGRWETFQRDPLIAGARAKIVSNSIRSIATRDGVVWIGTKLGLGRYDRRGWTHYTYAERLFDNAGLIDNRIATLAFDNSGALWIGHGNSKDFADGAGVTVLRDKTWQYLSTSDGLPSGLVYRVRSDALGGVWMATAKGVCRYRDSRFTTHVASSGLPSNRIRDIVSLGDGTVAVLTARGVVKINRGSPPRLIDDSDDVSGICASDGILYAGSHTEGLRYLEDDRWVMDPYFASNGIFSVSAAGDGTIWVLHARGIHSGRPGAWQPSLGPGGSAEFHAPRIFAGGEREAWITGAGPDRRIMQVPVNTMCPLNYRSGIPQPLLAHISYDPAGHAWLASPEGLQSLEGKRNIAGRAQRRAVPRISAWDDDGQVWMGTRDGFLFVREGDGAWSSILLAGHAPPLEITSLCPDGDTLWIGTANEGVIRLDISQLSGLIP